MKDYTIAVDHLTALDVAPNDLLLAAAAAGYDAAAIRIRPLDAGEVHWDLSRGTRLRRETDAVIRDTGMRLTAVEIIRLREDLRVDDIMPMLELATELGAEFVYVISGDEELDVITAKFHDVAGAVASFGLRALLEPMPYRSVNNVVTAEKVVHGTGAGILVDTLHFARSRMLDDLDAWSEMPSELFPLAQLCDAPAAAPTERDMHAKGAAIPAAGQASPVSPLQWEARVGRLLPGDGELPLELILAPLDHLEVLALEAPSPRAGDPAQLPDLLAAGKSRIELIMAARRNGDIDG